LRKRQPGKKKDCEGQFTRKKERALPPLARVKLQGGGPMQMGPLRRKKKGKGDFRAESKLRPAVGNQKRKVKQTMGQI